MIKAIVLCHPQSKDLLHKKVFKSQSVDPIRIACGTTRVKISDYRESSDFFPTYASYNSCLFETSVILTVWEHADELIGDNNVAILHTDIELHFSANHTWTTLDKELTQDNTAPYGLTVSSAYKGLYDEWMVPTTHSFRAKNDPMMVHAFDNDVHVWDYIKRYDRDIFDYAMDTNPQMIYSHQFACSRAIFDLLGHKLIRIVNRLKLSDIGFWTPHMFERLIALYLAKLGCGPKLTTAFWHYASSGGFGPGELSLYGPRGFKHYKICSRIINNHA